MNTASENLEFERAIEYRELINSVKRLLRNKRSQIRAEKTEIFWRQLRKGKMRLFKCFL